MAVLQSWHTKPEDVLIKGLLAIESLAKDHANATQLGGLDVCRGKTSLLRIVNPYLITAKVRVSVQSVLIAFTTRFSV